MIIPIGIAIVFFLGGAVLTVWATERMLQGLVGLATGLRVSAFVITAVLSGFEVENVAVGLVAASRGTASVALGSVFGGSIFLLCVAVGFAALLFPLKIELPRGVLLVFAATPLLAGLGLVDPVTPRWVGGVLLTGFALAIAYLIVVSRRKEFLGSHELDKARRKAPSVLKGAILTLAGIAVIGIGGEYVARGAEGLISYVGVPALLMGMVVTPATVSLEEIVRQAIPSKRGRHDVGTGNLVGTLLYFLLFNLGLIALVTPVRVNPLVRQLDWPFLILVTWMVTIFLWRGRVGRVEGLILLTAYTAYAALHLFLH
jgi:cation:H+ antiporter